MTESSPTYLRHGDYILLEVPTVEGCEHGGFFGCETLTATARRIIMDPRIETANRCCMAVLPHRKTEEGKMPHQDLFMCAVLQVASGIGTTNSCLTVTTLEIFHLLWC